MRFDDRGRELPDATPVAVPVGWKAPPTLQQQMQRFIRSELSAAAAQAGEESFEDADDFDVDDDPELKSPYDISETPVERWSEDRERRAAVEEAEKRVVNRKPPPKPAANSPEAKGPLAGPVGPGED